MDATIKAAVEAIHASPTQAVFFMSGGASQEYVDQPVKIVCQMGDLCGHARWEVLPFWIDAGEAKVVSAGIRQLSVVAPDLLSKHGFHIYSDSSSRLAFLIKAFIAQVSIYCIVSDTISTDSCITLIKQKRKLDLWSRAVIYIKTLNCHKDCLFIMITLGITSRVRVHQLCQRICYE